MDRTGRRTFLAATAALIAAPPGALRGAPVAEKSIAEITHSVVFPGRKTGVSWFHPRPCRLPGGQVLMTLQTISGSDYFGPVHWTSTGDGGKSWSEPQPIAALGRLPIGGGVEEGVCDVVPDYHGPTKSVLAIGHTVNYRGGRFYAEQPARWPVYVVRAADGKWGERQRLEWDDPRATLIYSCGCSQRVTRDDGDLIIPLTFGPKDRKDRHVTTVRCSLDGKELTIRDVGSALENPVGRGLLEPSLVSWDGRTLMTIRAEDNRGYVAASEDGLKWPTKQPWCWDDGEPLVMSTTQQHWLPHSDELWLVYTRRDDENENVMRWRAPLYMAQVDPAKLRLMRATERVVLPLNGDGVKEGASVPYFGNFHTLAASREESWITDCETAPKNRFHGDTLLARVRWTRPNRLVN